MFFKAVAILLVIQNVVYTECRPHAVPQAAEVIKEELLRSQAFSNLIQMIWQQVVAEYNKPQQEEIIINTTQGSFPTFPPQTFPSHISKTKGTFHSFGNNQVDVNQVKTILFKSESFNSLIKQIWEEISHRVSYNAGGMSQHNPGLPMNVDGTLDVEALKASFFSSESFNNLIQQIWQQISAQMSNSGQSQITWTGSTTQTAGQSAGNLNTKTVDQAANLNAKYSFGTEIIDNINGAYQMREEKRENGKLVGSYAYDNGQVYRTVHYEADDKGFRVLSDQSVPSVIVKQGRTGMAEVKTYRDGHTGHYQIKNIAATKY